MAPARAASRAERSVVVHGNVGGSIVVGDDNFVVHDNHGTIVVEKIQPTRTRRPVAAPPRPPEPFVGRTAELAQLAAAIGARGAITISGGSGAGRTALMRAAANGSGTALAGGVFRIDGVDDGGTALSTADLAQRLHDAAWETVPRAKVTLESARTELGQIEALAIVDDVTLPGRDLERLADLLPRGAVIIATSEPSPDGELADVAVGALDRPDSIALLAARAGIAAGAPDASDTAGDLDAICALLADWPEALVIGGRAMAARPIAPSAARFALEVIATGSTAPHLAALERAWALARPALDQNARQLLAAASSLPGRTHDPGLLRQILDDPTWFDAAVATLAALDLMTLNSPRLRIPDGIRALARGDAANLAPDIAERHLDVMLEAARERALDPDFTDAELGGLLGAFDRAVRHGRHDDAVGLGRSIAPHLVLHGLWDAWLTVARGVRAAAERTGRTADVAWAAHEMGTRDVALGDTVGGTALLREALSIRRSLGDTDGAAYTLHNLRWFGIRPVPIPRDLIRRILLGGGAIVVGAVLLLTLGPPAVAFIQGIVPTSGPTAEPTEEPTDEPTPTPTEPPPGLSVATVIGEYTLDGRDWATTLEITLTGGVGDYRVTLDGIGESSDNPSTFHVTGTDCQRLAVNGVATSGGEIRTPIAIDFGPSECPPTPPPLSVACVTFDDLAIGTVYGEKGGQRSGDEIFRTAERIRVSVVDFLWFPRVATTLSFAVSPGATSITGGDASGFAVGTRFWIDVGSSAEDAVVEDLSPGDVGGARIFLTSPLTAGHPAGSAVYVLDPDYGTFGTATVFEPDPAFGSGPFMWFNNVNLEFDFSGLPFVPTAVEFQFRDSGGNENLSVNGSEVYPAELIDAPSPIGGVSWSWIDPEADGTAVGTLKGTVERAINRFLIGGQEFALDGVCAYP